MTGNRWPRVRLGAIREGWDYYLREAGAWIVAVVLLLLCQAAINFALGLATGPPFRFEMHGGRPNLVASGRGEAHFLQTVLGIAVNGLFLGGMVRMACKQMRGQRIGAFDLFDIGDVLPNLLLASFLVAFATAVGLAACFVPGLIIAGLTMFTIPLVVDARMDATRAFGRSVAALKGQWLSATVFHIVAGLVAALGALLCCVGILFTAPLYALSITVLYRDFFLNKAGGGLY